MQKESYRKILEQELHIRSVKNPAYSMRSFARDLDISSSALSEIISGKRGLSVKKAEEIIDKMGSSPEKKNHFLDSVKSTKAAFKKKSLKDSTQALQIELDNFSLISEWYHFAILSLMKLSHFKSDKNWIANRLGITLEETTAALERLERLKIVEFKENKYTRQQEWLKTSDDISHHAIKAYHKEILLKAISSLELDPVEKREITAVTMPINSKKIPEAKIKIRKFKEDLSEFLIDGNSDRVYSFNLQLFPLDREED